MENSIDRAAQHCGGLGKLASALGVSAQVASNWRLRGVPIERCAELELATDGHVMRWHLRPDDWWKVWPELLNSPGAPEVPATEVANG